MKSKILIFIVLVCLISINFSGGLSIKEIYEDESEIFDNSDGYLRIEDIE